MSSEAPIQVSEQLVDAWQRELLPIIGAGDSAQVRDDASDPHAVRITFQVAGHTGYSLDFKCEYVDEREVRVSLVDVETSEGSVDERTEAIQALVKQYMRYIHECAQVLQQVTNA